MSKSGIRKRDLFYPSLGCVTYSIAAVEEKQTLPRNSQLGCLLQGVKTRIFKVSVFLQQFQRQTWSLTYRYTEQVKFNSIEEVLQWLAFVRKPMDNQNPYDEEYIHGSLNECPF